MKLASLLSAAAIALALTACEKPVSKPAQTPVASGEVIHVTTKGFKLKGAEDFTFVNLENENVLKKLKSGQKVTIYGEPVKSAAKDDEKSGSSRQQIELSEIVLSTGERITVNSN